MTDGIIGRPDDEVVTGYQMQLRALHARMRAGLTRKEYMQAQQWDRRVRQVRPFLGFERRCA